MGVVSQLNSTFAEQDPAYAGMLADLKDSQVDSYVSGEASAEIAFGWGVVKGADPTGGFQGTGAAGNNPTCKIPSGGGDFPVGIALHSHAYQQNADIGATGIKPTKMVAVLRKGRAWVFIEDTVTKGSALFLRYTANGAGKTPGQFRSDADTAKALKVRGISAALDFTGPGVCPVDVDMDAFNAVNGLTDP